jgi:hypothetical protein
MKKIFLLSLLSVLFLSAFSQTIISNSSEVLATISIHRSAADDDNGDVGGDVVLVPWWPKWWFLYREVTTNVYPGGMSINCIGMGWKLCIPKLSDLFQHILIGVDPESMDAICQEMIETSNEQVENRGYQGSISRKLAFSDQARSNNQFSYLLFQMNWNYDLENPRNGKAEITISKTDNLGF